jgi:hypothetical protein
LLGAQGVLLVIFIVFGVLALLRFPPDRQGGTL